MLDTGLPVPRLAQAPPAVRALQGGPFPPSPGPRAGDTGLPLTGLPHPSALPGSPPGGLGAATPLSRRAAPPSSSGQSRPAPHPGESQSEVSQPPPAASLRRGRPAHLPSPLAGRLLPPPSHWRTAPRNPITRAYAARPSPRRAWQRRSSPLASARKKWTVIGKGKRDLTGRRGLPTRAFSLP